MNQYEKERAIINIRDYYSPPISANALEKLDAAFNRAKEEYIKAIQNQIEVAKKITLCDVFPKARISASLDDAESAVLRTKSLNDLTPKG